LCPESGEGDRRPAKAGARVAFLAWLRPSDSPEYPSWHGDGRSRDRETRHLNSTVLFPKLLAFSIPDKSATLRPAVSPSRGNCIRSCYERNKTSMKTRVRHSTVRTDVCTVGTFFRPSRQPPRDTYPRFRGCKKDACTSISGRPVGRAWGEITFACFHALFYHTQVLM
jgi:hypothetical protein